MRPTQEGGLQFETIWELDVTCEVLSDLNLEAISKPGHEDEADFYGELYNEMDCYRDVVALEGHDSLPSVDPVLARYLIDALVEGSHVHPEAEIRAEARAIHEDATTRAIRQAAALRRAA